jgi:hypothetical protein
MWSVPRIVVGHRSTHLLIGWICVLTVIERRCQYLRVHGANYKMITA